jgi:hypothetical protein
MQIASLLELAQRQKLPPLQRKTLAFLEEHPDEVFAYRDQKLIEAMGCKASAMGFTLWALHKAGLIEKETVAGKAYFGSREAIASLRKGLGVDHTAFERAYQNLLKIRERVGNLDNIAALDAVRSGD